MVAADKNLATGEEELKKNKGAQDTNEDDYDNAEKYLDIEEEEEEESSSSSSEEEEEEDQVELALRKLALESKKRKKELTDAEMFDFLEDPENWTEEDLQEIWADAHPELIDDIGWDPDVISWSDWDQIQDLREKGEKVTTEPFYVPYRKYYPPILKNHIDINSPMSVVEELERLEEFIKWVSYVFKDRSTFMAQSEVENAVTNSTQPVPTTNALKSQPRKSILSRIWNGIFRSSNEDFEKTLQHLSKEEASVHARSKR